MMELDESLRHELFDALDTTLGPRPAATLMAHLPPVGWADVATKHDLHELERRIDHRFEVVEVRFDSVERRLAGNDGRFDGIDSRLDRIDTRLEGMDARLRAVETGLRDLGGELRAEMAKQSRALFVGLGGLIVGLATVAATVGGILLATGRLGAG